MLRGLHVDIDPKVRAWARRVVNHYGSWEAVRAASTWRDGKWEVPWPLDAEAPTDGSRPAPREEAPGAA